MLDYMGIVLPDDVEHDILFASQIDVERTMIIGAMRATGVYQRVHTTELAKGRTILRFASINAVGTDVVKALCTRYAIVCYELVDAEFFQTQKEKLDSTEDRLYFHAICNHKKTGF